METMSDAEQLKWKTVLTQYDANVVEQATFEAAAEELSQALVFVPTTKVLYVQSGSCKTSVESRRQDLFQSL